MIGRMILCDNCGKYMAVGSVQRLQERTQGEYRVRWFGCPHCGFKYFAGCADDEQRELQRRLRKMQNRRKKSLKRMREVRKKQQTWRREQRVLEEMKKRNAKLREIGQKILAGEDVTADDDKM